MSKNLKQRTGPETPKVGRNLVYSSQEANRAGVEGVTGGWRDVNDDMQGH